MSMSFNANDFSGALTPEQLASLGIRTIIPTRKLRVV